MDDTPVVRRLESVAQLACDCQRLIDRQGFSALVLRKRRSRHELHDDHGLAAGILDAENLSDVGVVERAEHLGFALEARPAIGMAGERVGQHLQRDLALEPCVACPEDLAHPPWPMKPRISYGPTRVPVDNVTRPPF